MIEQLSEIQARVHGMREALLNEGSVMPDECVITRLDAKKKVLWYLDLLAGAIAGAHRHMSNIEDDDIFSGAEKEAMQQQIIDRLQQELEWLPAAIKDCFYCLGTHFKELDRHELQPPLPGHTQENLSEKQLIVSETLAQLELLEREVDDIWGVLTS